MLVFIKSGFLQEACKTKHCIHRCPYLMTDIGDKLLSYQGSLFYLLFRCVECCDHFLQALSFNDKIPECDNAGETGNNGEHNSPTLSPCAIGIDRCGDPAELDLAVHRNMVDGINDAIPNDPSLKRSYKCQCRIFSFFI